MSPNLPPRALRRALTTTCTRYQEKEVAEVLRCSTRTVSRLISVGRLASLKITDGGGSGRQLIPREELERLLRDAA